jgi:hypothetical protein
MNSKVTLHDRRLLKEVKEVKEVNEVENSLHLIIPIR